MLLADIGDSVQRGFDEFATWVPRLAAFLLILVVGYFVAKLAAGLVRRLLDGVGFERALHAGTAGRWAAKVTNRPSELLGTIAFWAVLIGAISIGLDVLGIQALQDFVGEVWAYVPNVIAALLIFIVAGLLAAGTAAFVARTMGDTPTGRVVGAAAPILIMAIAGFMILDQLEIAGEIVTITYAALVGATALGMALAFGLGGREVASEMLRDAYDGSRAQVKEDLRLGAERARAEAERRAHEEPSETDTVVAPYEADEPQLEPEPADEPLLEPETRNRSRRGRRR